MFEWLSLVNLSGLLVSEPVLRDAFPNGLPSLDNQLLRRYRIEYERWRSTKNGDRWTDFVLTDLLGYHLYGSMSLPPQVTIELTEYMQKLKPDKAVIGSDGNIQLLVYFADGDLDRPETATGRWKASPFTKFDRLLRETGVPLGLLVNQMDWRLVFAQKGVTTSYIEWSAATMLDEYATLQAFRALLSDPIRLLNMANESQDRQADVTDQLGSQVLDSMSILIAEMDRAGRDTLHDMTPREIYEMGLFVMMRLVFMFYAEENRLLPHGDRFYDQGYGIIGLWNRLEHERRYDDHSQKLDAWPQLLAAFRMIYEGCEHPDFPMPAYGGDLFNPEKYSILNHIPISNRAVWVMLRHLTTVENSDGRQRVSYRALNVEQLGSTYERLLDHTAVRATEPVLGLIGTKYKEPEIPLSELEKQWQKGDDNFLDFLKEETGRSRKALENALLNDDLTPNDEQLLHHLCGEDLYPRIRPFATLLRTNDLKEPFIVFPGGLYVTSGTTRRATGTHYTPRSLTEPIVQHTLDPLIYEGMAEGKPDPKLRTAKHILDLKICDMAMGSGAFLVQACRYLSEKLVEAWAGADYITDDGTPTRDKTAMPLPINDEERKLLARRLVADRCLYGVDKNPLAVEMAKLSLWLATLDKNRPFTFLDHALKSGDSLVGVTFDQLRAWSLQPEKVENRNLFSFNFDLLLDEMIAIRRQIAHRLVLTIDDQRDKDSLLQKANAIAHDLRSACDALILSYFNDLPKSQQERFREALLYTYRDGKNLPDNWRGLTLGDLQPFHWELEFPEVFLRENKGFDAFVGNPPFLGGLRISTMNGANYLTYLRLAYPSSSGTADLCAFFFLRGFEALRNNGNFGLIATNTIAQGDTRQTGLDYIINQQGEIYRANPSVTWPGVAAVYVSIVHISKGHHQAQKVLINEHVQHISALLDDVENLGNPHILKANENKSFVGSYVLGMGFVMLPEEAQLLIEKDARNNDVLFPYINGEDLNSHPDQSPSRWVINFFDWDLAQAEQYPDCVAIVREKIYPERVKLIGRNSIGTKRGTNWWLYGSDSKQLYRAIAPTQRVLAIARVTKYVAFSFLPTGLVYSEQIVILAVEEMTVSGLLNSSIYSFWCWKHSSTMGANTLRYSSSDVFETFPFPQNIESLETIGETYHETRRQIMLNRWEGLTNTYNRFHNPAETANDIQELRELHVEMDNQVAAAYGWNDLNLAHGFHDTAQGIRFTISEPARREVLTRLLQLNHQRYAEEVAAGLHDKKKKKSVGAGVAQNLGKQGLVDTPSVTRPDDLPEQTTMFDDDTPKQNRLL